MSPDLITLERFLREEEATRLEPEPDLSALLRHTASAAIGVERGIRRAALVGLLGLAGEENPSGDAQKKLDVLANDLFVEAISGPALVAGIISEEIEEVRRVPGGDDAPYLLGTDPLDGSSNTDINGVVASIFGFYRRRRSGPCGSVSEELGGGMDLAAAGYVMYGPSTVLVYSRGAGVNGFTLESDRGEFVLSHREMRCPERGSIYSANLGRYNGWHPNIRRFADWLVEQDKPTKRPYTLRYVGALVADFHRSLIQGGLFFYPGDDKNRDGKLRLLYECAPMAFLAEQSGGAASTGWERVLDVRPRTPHQRVPLVIGSRREVELYERFLAGKGP